MKNEERIILESINKRFPSGRHSSRIIVMLNGEVEYDRKEIMTELERIKIGKDSDRRYGKPEDAIDAENFLNQFREIEKSEMENW